MNMPERPPSPPAPPSGYLPVARDLVPSGRMFWWTVGAFFAGVLGANLIGIFFVAANADLTDPIPFTVVFVGQSAGSFFLIWMFSQRAASGSLQADVGLRLSLSDWWGLPAGMGLQVVAAFATYPLIRLMFPDGAPEQGVAGIAEGTETSMEIILIFVSVAVLAPIVEEIIYRGMLLSWLHRFMGKWPAIVLSAAVFAGIHLIDWNARAAIPGLFLIGIVLGWAALKRGDLSLAIPLHAGVNLLAAFLLVWGTEIVDWAENQVGDLEPIDGIVRWFGTLAGF
ncbi:MAG: CPBP family intramembrane metalloprotease [Armatimonadetes bacterium]|nr:MAG: CPBP family intramembrane metalloprotease [Armatimonadota bacterium]